MALNGSARLPPLFASVSQSGHCPRQPSVAGMRVKSAPSFLVPLKNPSFKEARAALIVCILCRVHGAVDVIANVFYVINSQHRLQIHGLGSLEARVRRAVALAWLDAHFPSNMLYECLPPPPPHLIIHSFRRS